ncbi:PAS domain-containing protein [Tropicibacter oceani]|uniref:PAS domain-containing protein n=1 Tax=Tropicibacter oceani TaxID=3058420 RepID=A0ABY8QH56_9RHOB|nr:PAS domain-containing protein [Tropicibacter oceani]WGW03974.1 PAS domain-containing protein [Tropicibacter oceani]
MTELNPEFTAEAQRTAKGALPFAIGEMFYSRTDKRGIIAAGNSVFQRLAGYDWADLIGAPHKIIRHEDMPRGVFHMMWGRLQDGMPTGCYVKNKAKDGRYYWVFALVSPTENGYLSTRLKPTSPMLETVQGIYAELLRRETEEGLNAADSAKALDELFRAQGFSNYGTFQATAMAQEFEMRARQLGHPLDTIQTRFLDMSKAISDVAEETAGMTEAFRAIRTVPMNMSIIASRLENAGGPISAISVNYSQMLEEMSSWVTTFVQGDKCVFSKMRGAIFEGQFLSFARAIQAEMNSEFLKHEAVYPDSIDVAAERARLEAREKDFLQKTAASLHNVEIEARRFARSVLDMKRYVTGLSSTRMMCKIESASLAESGTELAGIVDQLDAGQNEIEARLARIVELNAVIQGSTGMLRSLF